MWSEEHTSPIIAPQLTFQRYVERLDDGDVQAEAVGGGRHLGPDESGTDDDDPGQTVHQVGPQGLSVVQGTQRVHTGQPVRAGEPPGTGAGRDHDTVGAQLPSCGQGDGPRRGVEPHRALTQQPLHAQAFVLLRVAEGERIGVEVALEKFLGQRRAVVGGVALLPHDGDVAVITLCAQRADRAQPRQRRSDDGDTPHSGTPVVTQTGSPGSRSSIRRSVIMEPPGNGCPTGTGRNEALSHMTQQQSPYATCFRSFW